MKTVSAHLAPKTLPWDEVAAAGFVKALERDRTGRTPVLDAGTRDPAVAYPDESVDDALNRMLLRGCGRLPVVSRDDPGRYVGYLGRAAVLNARLRRIAEEQVREPGWLARFFTDREDRAAS